MKKKIVKRKITKKRKPSATADSGYYYERIDPSTLSAKQKKRKKKKEKPSRSQKVCDKEWKGMPEFVQENLEPWRSVKVHFADRKSFLAFSKLVKQKLTKKTRSIWYPEADIGIYSNKEYASES